MLFVQLLVDGFVTGCAVGVVAITFAYVYSATGIFHVGHAGLYTVGAYLGWYGLDLGMPFVLAVAFAMLGSAAVGMFVQKFVYSPLLERKASPLVLLIASLGLLYAMQNIVAIAFTPDMLAFKVPWRQNSLIIGSLYLSYAQVAIVISSLAIFAGMMWFSRATLTGQRIRAVASNRDLAVVTRLRPDRVYLIVIAIASGLVAVPALLTGIDQQIQPYTSILVLLVAVIAMIAGGIGSIPGAFVLAIVISCVQTVSIIFIPGQWALAFTYSVFIIFILIKPRGLFRTLVQRAS